MRSGSTEIDGSDVNEAPDARERRYSAAERYRLRTGRDVEMESTKGEAANAGERRDARAARHSGAQSSSGVVGMCFAEVGIARIYGSDSRREGR